MYWIKCEEFGKNWVRTSATDEESARKFAVKNFGKGKVVEVANVDNSEPSIAMAYRPDIKTVKT